MKGNVLTPSCGSTPTEIVSPVLHGIESQHIARI